MEHEHWDSGWPGFRCDHRIRASTADRGGAASGDVCRSAAVGRLRLLRAQDASRKDGDHHVRERAQANVHRPHDRWHLLPHGRTRDRDVGDTHHYISDRREAGVHQEPWWWPLLSAARRDRVLDTTRTCLPNTNGQRRGARPEEGREGQANGPTAAGHRRGHRSEERRDGLVPVGTRGRAVVPAWLSGHRDQ